ncbi:MAG: cell division protein FtsQ/DivIB [Candidatus Eiseniibacteriota bacterium]
MRSPALLLASALLVLAGAIFGVRAAWRALSEHPAFSVGSVSVRGVAAVSADEVIRRAGIRPGDPWLALDGEEAARRVRSLHRVHDAKIRRPWIGRVRIDVRECIPEARVVVRNREYGLCDHLRIIPAGGDERRGLPLFRTTGKFVDPDALAKGFVYLEELRDEGVGEDEAVEITLDAKGGDRIRLPGRGLTVTVDAPVPPSVAAKNVAAFLETLDEKGGARGTLRLVSETTAVWRAAA